MVVVSVLEIITPDSLGITNNRCRTPDEFPTKPLWRDVFEIKIQVSELADMPDVRKTIQYRNDSTNGKDR